MNTAAKKNKGGAGSVLESLLGTVTIEKAAPQARIAEVHSSQCRMWKFADRPDDEAEHIEDIMASIMESGQIHAAIARDINDPSAPTIKYEIIVGNVRWQACTALDIPLRIEVKDINDQQAYLMMMAENIHRKEISEYSRALSYAKAIEEGLFESKKTFSAISKIAPSTLSYYLAFATLPEHIVKALGSMRDISLAMGYRLSQAVKQLPDDEVMALIPAIKENTLSAAKLEAMLAGTEKPKVEPEHSVDLQPGSAPTENPLDISGQETDGQESDADRNAGAYGDNDHYGVGDGVASTATVSNGPESSDSNEHRPETEQPNSHVPEFPEKEAKSSKPASKNTSESDLQRAEAMRGRIDSRIAMGSTRTSGLSDLGPTLNVSLTFAAQLATYLDNNAGALQGLMSHLKDAAGTFLELEVPLDLFDKVEAQTQAGDNQVDWTKN